MNYSFTRGIHMIDLIRMTDESIIKNTPESIMEIGHRKPYSGTGTEGYCGPVLSARTK